ncbi:MAG: hypothetical protein QOF77_998 [Solirubrobacteraceae bacterium]|jgi:hypothetical protein|nr:hypothetical protein [Solirubrobacteraceae bacterium]
MTPPSATGASARTAAPARRPLGPRRVSGPARRPAAAPPLVGPRHGLRRLVDHPLLDRLIRGRTWIGIVAFALIGIVAMEVALLKLNAGIGRSVQRAAVLQRENSLLSAAVSSMQTAGLDQAGATGQGMVYAPPGDVRYLTAATGDAARAAASIAAPGTPGSGAASTTSATSLGAGGQPTAGLGASSLAGPQPSSTGALTPAGGASGSYPSGNSSSASAEAGGSLAGGQPVGASGSGPPIAGAGG